MIHRTPELDSVKLAADVVSTERKIKAAQDVIRGQRKLITKLRADLDAKRRTAGWEFP